jgi:hypothetical protein
VSLGMIAAASIPKDAKCSKPLYFSGRPGRVGDSLPA